MLAVSGPAGPSLAQFSSLETEDLRLVYVDPLTSYIVPYAGRCFESALRFHSQLFSYEPREKVTVLLLDLSDTGRANAGPIPRDNLTINLAPVNIAYETLAPNERLNTIMNHELAHVVSMDQASSAEERARRFFHGKILPTSDHPESLAYMYLTTPRVASPSWYLEGVAVFLETWMAGGIGRAQGAYDEMVFRSMVRDETPFYDPLGLVSEGTKIDFQVGVNAYLYGTRFVSYLAYVYGPESVISWVARKDGGKKYYASQFEAVYHKTIEEAWQDWIAFEKEFQEKNLAAIREHPTTAYRDLSSKALGSVSRAFYDPQARVVYAAFHYPGVVAHVGAIHVDDGRVERLLEVKDPVLFSVTSLAWDPASRTLFYTADNSAYRDLRALDPETKKTRTLIKDARIGDLAFDAADRSLWGIRQLNGISTLVRIPFPYTEWNQIYSFPFGQVPYDLDLSPDGKLLSASVGEVTGKHTLRVFDVGAVLTGELTPVAETDFGTSIPSNFVFARDGRTLYGSSYYSGVSNIFRFDVETRTLDALTNAETGMFRPIPYGDDALIVFRYSGRGFVPAVIEARPVEDVSAITFLGEQVAEKHPLVRSWIAGSPAAIPLDSLVVRRGPYRPWHEVRLESIYPVLEGYKDSVAAGVSAIFSDPILMNRLTLDASYSPDRDLPSEERLHLLLRYDRLDWHGTYKLNGADFYDLFGPTKKSRKGYSLEGGWKKTLLYDTPREAIVDLSAAYYGNIDRLPYFQNVEAPSDELLSTAARFDYANVRSSLGSVDGEKGIKTSAYAGTNRAHGDVIPYLLASFDAGFPLPFPHSSLWLRSSAGVASGELEDPFANFYFGGFGNNWVDQGETKRYREWYSFPGLPLNELGGRDYVKSLLDLNLPPLRFARAGKPGCYLTWARTSLFAGAIETNLNVDDARRRVQDVGAQVDFRFAALHQFELTLSLGYARAFERGAATRDETMVSLKLLR